MRYYIFCCIRFLVLLFPRRVCYAGARVLAFLYYSLAKKDRIALAFNIAPFVPEKERRKVVRDVFLNFSYYLVDFFRYDKLDRAFIEKYVTVRGRENIDQALRGGKGVLLLTAHLGNYELGGAVVALLGYDMYAVALPHEDIRTNRLFDRQRNKVGIKVISTGSGIKGCFEAFKAKAVLGFLGDRAFSGKTIGVNMFSRNAELPRGFASLAAHANAQIVPAFFVRQKNIYRYELIFDKPIDIAGRTLEQIAQDYADILAGFISMYPQQWYMFVRFWSQS